VAGTGSSDILMLLVKTGNTQGIPAESQTKLSSLDTLLSGPPKFEEGKFFELETFSINLASHPHDATTDNEKTVTVKHVGAKGGGASGQRLSRDTKWLPANLQPISCTRQVDHASSVLFDQVGKDGSFDAAAIVSRKVVGGTAQSDGSNLMGYFRADFTTVVITDVTWSADETGIKETIQFVCKKAQVLYRQQTHTGSVSDKRFPPGIWP
jgi:type VI protein secretion system component Hcp